MQTVNEALRMLKRQAELQRAMKQPGGVRITEEQELHVLRQKLMEFPEAMEAALQAAHAMRRPISEITARDVELWAKTTA